MTTLNPDHVARLAAGFTAELKRTLTPAEWAEMVSINRDDPIYWQGGACASHNYCDSNMVMAAAFETAFSREIDLDSDDDLDLWNAAWNAAFTEWTGRPRP